MNWNGEKKSKIYAQWGVAIKSGFLKWGVLLGAMNEVAASWGPFDADPNNVLPTTSV